MKKIFVGNLPGDSTEASVTALLSEYGTVRSIRLPADIFTGRCRGFALIEMEGHEARAAVAALDGKTLDDKILRVRFDADKKKKGRGRGR